ncbi:hypothetical protein [Streptomyces cirratus]|uniref:hypothetical protein n=1 Tax=Streptomyces cirratus TaxID=68187 RepID=UPI003609CE2A
MVASDLLAKGFAARLAGGPSADAWEVKLMAYGTTARPWARPTSIAASPRGELVVIQQQRE